MSSGSHNLVRGKAADDDTNNVFASGISILFLHKLRISYVVVDALDCLCNPP